MKYSMMGGVEWQIQDRTKLSVKRPRPSAVFYGTAWIYGAFTDLLIFVRED